VDPDVEAGPEGLAELGFEDLAGATLRQRIGEPDVAWDFVGGESLATPGAELFRRDDRIGLQDDDRHRDLAALLVRRRDDSALEDRRVRAQRDLDLDRRDVLAGADDDVLRAVLDRT